MIAETRLAFLREREPSADEVLSELEVTPCHFGLILLIAIEP